MVHDERHKGLLINATSGVWACFDCLTFVNLRDGTCVPLYPKEDDDAGV